MTRKRPAKKAAGRKPSAKPKAKASLGATRRAFWRSGFIVVKRRGHKEEFDGRKLYASVYHACKDSHMSEERSEEVASKVLARVQAELRDKTTVDAHSLFLLTARELSRIDGEAGFMYEHHFDIS